MKIRTVGAELFNADGQEEGRTVRHEDNRRFSQVWESAYKSNPEINTRISGDL
jgi:hypothetical protein